MINITVEEANDIVNARSNGSLQGIGVDKGGRAWLDGEWELNELEALCVVIRQACGKLGYAAVGAEELIAGFKANLADPT